MSWTHPAASGVFLKSVLDVTARRLPRLGSSRLRGDPTSTVSTSIRLRSKPPVSCCFTSVSPPIITRNKASPWALWHRIRCNLCVADALTFEVVHPDGERPEALAPFAIPTQRRLTTYRRRWAKSRRPGATTVFSKCRPLGHVYSLPSRPWAPMSSLAIHPTREWVAATTGLHSNGASHPSAQVA